jgi:hypothetical protein
MHRTVHISGAWPPASLVRRINGDSQHHEHITGLRDGLFILLGLLLGFTVAMVLPLFDQRSQLVADEANPSGRPCCDVSCAYCKLLA